MKTRTTATGSLLIWDEGLGQGRCEIPESRDVATYGQGYFDKYVEYARTQMGRDLLDFRLRTLLGVWEEGDGVLDVGIGCGSFVEACRKRKVRCDGWDVSAVAMRWLKQRTWQRKELDYEVVTFWDSLEHTVDPGRELRSATKFALVSLPICESRDDWLRSKHFRPDEHRWYWTRSGFSRFAQREGFVVDGWSDRESRLGRESIQTFVLKRVSSAP